MSMVYLVDSQTIVINPLSSLIRHKPTQKAPWYHAMHEVLEVHGSLDQTTLTFSDAGCFVTGSTAVAASSCGTILAAMGAIIGFV